MAGSFDSLYTHDFLRTAVAVPQVRVADPAVNAERTVALAQKASETGAAVCVFPELGLSTYASDDLFHQDALLESVRSALRTVRDATHDLTPVLCIGLPLRVGGALFNVAAVCYRGRILGLVPKSFLPNYREFYEKRQFTSGRKAVPTEVDLFGETVPFGTDLLFDATTLEAFTLFVEICEDVWTPIPPSTYGAMGGATILANLSASNVTIGKAGYRHSLCEMQSAKCLAGYLYAAAGTGESTTDLAWDGHGLIYENARCLAETERFARGEQLITGDVDAGRLLQERMRMTSFNDAVGEYRERVQQLRRIPFDFEVPTGPLPLQRDLARTPYVPQDPDALDERCEEAYRIQVHGLAQRLDATGIERVVIGVSGGLDSTQALIVAVRTMEELGLPRTNVLAYTLPGFATSDRTLRNAHALMDALGVTAEEIPIRDLATDMLEALDHPAAEGEAVYDVTYENVQAGARTSLLFRLANHHDALVVGTGDLSELALGWCTYGVGDQMSHYAVNASVPKTLIQHLIRWVSRRDPLGESVEDVLTSILDTEISPELIPGDTNGAPTQSSEEVVGPYPLQDFNLYYTSRFGLRPSKVAFLAHHAWGPDSAEDGKLTYTLSTIKKWLRVFIQRFIAFSQFKRSAVPNAPKVGSGGSLSPRGDWRAPSDASATAWLEELERNVPDGVDGS